MDLVNNLQNKAHSKDLEDLEPRMGLGTASAAEKQSSKDWMQMIC